MASAESAKTSMMGGITPFDWSTAVRPLLAATYGNFPQNDLVKLAKCIEASGEQIMKHDSEFEPFYSLFAALATHHLCANASTITKANLPTVVNACRVLAEFILSRLETPHSHCSVMPKQFVLLVKSLCKGLGFLQRSDIITLAALLKSSQLPPHIRATIGAEKLSEDESSMKGRKKEKAPAGTSATPAPARAESVMSSLIDFLSVPMAPDSVVEKTKDSSKPSTPTDTFKDVKDQFVTECMQHLMRLNAGSVLIDVCLKLPFLARYNLMYRDMMRGETPFTNLTAGECQSIFESYSSFLNDVVMVSRVVVLPLLEPLTPERLSKLCSLGCTCLLAACTVVIAYNNYTPKSNAEAGNFQELETFTNNIVEKSLVIFSTILNSIQISNNIGGMQLQNMRALGSLCIGSALAHMHHAFEINGAVVCIAQQYFTLLQPLFADLKLDPGKAETVGELMVNSVFTPSQRFEYINRRCKIPPVLLTIAHDSFLRGIDLLRENRTSVKATGSEAPATTRTPEIDTDSDVTQVQSVPNTPSESDSETVLGSWLEELLSSVPQLVDSAVKQSAGILHSGLRRRTTAASESSSILGVKEDTHTYMSLAISSIRMLNDDLLYGYRTDLLKKSVSSCWTEQEVGYLATLIRNFDRHYETGSSTDDSLAEFKTTLTKFVHNLIANGLLGESLETCLLAKLDIGIGAEDAESDWPLHLSSCLAGILCQMLLLRQNKERDESGHSETGAVVVRIWNRLLLTLKKNSFKKHDYIDVVDMNVEHLQVMLSLFHSLPLMRKKTVLLELCKTIKEVVQENRTSRFLNANASSHFTRMLLIFDYLLRFFYEPPQALLQQLKKNVFPVQAQTASDGDLISLTPVAFAREIPVHFACADIEEIYRAEMPMMQQVKTKPFFYNLAPSLTTDEVPKLDGLAATFIQNSFDYNDLYDCFCDLAFFYDRVQPTYDREGAFQRALLRYCCALTWRVLKLLPPSVRMLEEAISWTPATASSVPMAKACVFLVSTGIRLTEAAFAAWVKDGLIKQGQTADQVEQLVRKILAKNSEAALILALIEHNISRMKSNWRVEMEERGVEFPPFVDMVYTDLLLCRGYALLDSSRQSDGEKAKIPADVAPVTIFKSILVDLLAAARSLVIERAIRSPSDPLPSTPAARKAALKLMSLCGAHPHAISTVATTCWFHAHSSLRGSVEFWNRRNLNEFPAAGSWRNEFALDFAPIDSYLGSVYSAHLTSLSNDWLSSQLITFKRLVHTSFHLVADTISWYPNVLQKKDVDNLMVPVMFDVLASHFSDFAFSVLTTVHGANEHDVLQECLYRHALPTAYEIIIEHSLNSNGVFGPAVAEICLQLLEFALETISGRKTVIYVLSNIGNVNTLLRAAVQPGTSLGFTTALVRLLGKIFQTTEMVQEKDFNEFCHDISKSFSFESQLLWELLSSVFVLKEETDTSPTNQLAVMTECCTFLDAVAKSANRALSCDSIEISRLLLETMIPVMTIVLSTDYQSNFMADAGVQGPFAKLFATASRFASVGRGLGHCELLKAANDWMKLCTERMGTADALSQIKTGATTTTLHVLSEAASTIMNYLNELMNIFNQRRSEMTATAYDSDVSSAEQDLEGSDEFAAPAEDEDSAEESDEDALDSKLCTFTVTQKEFMNQHWYHCHTCGMVDGEGVCSICARVCHKGHDLSYSKYGSFFCDCGAKSEPTCKALVKRSTKSTPKPTASATGGVERSLSGIRRSVSRGQVRAKTTTESRKSADEQRKLVLFYGDSRDREELKKELMNAKTDIATNLLHFLDLLTPAVVAAATSNSSIGNLAKLRKSLDDLHSSEEFRCDTVETLATLTGGSQENAFENVGAKLSFSGDQGQTIKQLLVNHVLHRACLACASSQNRKRQFLVVVHDRCKISIMHLSSFLKQVEGGKKKPTLARSASESFPFSVLSVSENSMCEDYVAICGLKDCVVVTLSQTGCITDRLTLHLGLDVGNFLIKALWLPGSMTEIALITADFVRIYDLAKNTARADYDFLLPAGKIRDATFICRDVLGTNGQTTVERYLLLMTSSGYIYTQTLGDHCRNAIHGSFYITDMVEIKHEELEESNGNLGGGGVSIYYSHGLQLLFVSYSSGKNIFFSLTPQESGLGTVKKLHFITWKSQKSVSSQALCRWSETQGHSGVLVALTQSSMSPVVLFLRPGSILVQEMTLPPKAKVLDAVLCRSSGAFDEAQSSLLLLCEDGSARTVGVSKELTDFWMKKPSSFRFPVVQTPYRTRTTRVWKSERSDGSEFAVDFFEQCQQLLDIEFGGSDLLQMYHTLQLRNRLQTSNLYVVSSKSGGFQLEILNRESGMAICGVRIEVGKHSLEKSPTYIEIFGRRRPLSLTHARWIDFPFTKDESIMTGNKLVITFGPVADPNSVCIVDSAKVYGKSKEVFGWPDDIEDDVPPPLAIDTTGLASQVSSSTVSEEQPPQQQVRASPAERDIGGFERAIMNAFETLATAFMTFSNLTDCHAPATGRALQILTTSAHRDTVRSAKSVLRLLSSSKTDYYNNKDSYILKHVMASLKRTEVNTDPEHFSFLVSLVRSIAVNRTQSLIVASDAEKNESLLNLLPESFWKLRDLVSSTPAICPVGSVEIENVEGLVRAIVDILHAHCVANNSLVPVVAKALVKLLLCEDLQIAVACRQAICWIYRRQEKRKRPVIIPYYPKPPLPPKVPDPVLPSFDLLMDSPPQPAQQLPQPQPFELMGDEPMQAVPANALLVEDDTDGEPDAEGADQVYEIHADGDEEAMMELAIALSLQDQQASAGAGLGSANVANNSNYPAVVSVQESLDGGHLSDTTGSGLSDEEGSTAATEGSMLRISPSEDRLPSGATAGAASDSGGSGAESGSGRSSNDGEQSAAAAPPQGQATSATLQPQQTESERDKNKNHKLLLTFLDCLIDAMPEVEHLSGIHCISYMQVLTNLLSSFECTDDAEKKLVTKLLDSIVAGLDFSPEAATAFCRRSSQSEVRLLKLRFITVLLSRSKGKSPQQMSEADKFICSYTAGALVRCGVLDYCLVILKTLLQQAQAADSVASTKLLELRPDTNPPDLAPFFLRPYVKEHSRDVFESYTQLITEMAMRLPYQVKKVVDMCRSIVPYLPFDPAWNSVLCEFLRSEQSSFVKKHVRKLFMFICGSKEKYRQMRDLHSLEFDLKAVKTFCSPTESTLGRPVALDYGTLNTVMDHLKSCCDVALNRAGNWQKFCVTNTDMFWYLLQLSVMVDDNVASTVLTLLNAAICLPDGKESKKKAESRHEADRFRFMEKHAAVLAELLLSEQQLPLLITCLRRYLFECNTTDRRWQMHGFVKALFGCAGSAAPQRLLDILWRELWPEVPHHGRKAVQFVDLVGYYTLKLASPQMIAECATNVLALLKTQNQMLSQHTNANIYNALASLLEFDGYYLESNPCLVCNNPEISMTNLKLSSLKMDARYTTSSQILKLIGSHEIAKITLKISEIRRTKMVKRLSLFYSNKSVQSAVELKNRPDLWTLAKRFTLAQNQQELKMDFAVPIVACNLVMEYSEFYEAPLTASEMIHCPRCSASVPAQPGVCNNCGENVYQCHKCRAINYDERDPFLCNACGYSKYGKFDYTVTARPVAGVEPIENEEDRKKVCTLINSLLEKADQIYRQLQVNRQHIETALARISGQDLSTDDGSNVSPLTVSTTTGQVASTGAMTFVTKNIQLVALKYNRDCRTSFDELSKVVQKIIANRAELVEYDRRIRESLGLPPGTEKLRILQSSPKCFGCAASTAQQCILLIRGMASSSTITTNLITSQKELMKELIDVAVKQNSARARQAARELVCSIIHNQEEATDMVCNHITRKVTRALSEPNWSTAVVTSLVQVELHLLAASLQLMDKCWERRLRCALDVFMKSTASPSSAVVEAVTMPLMQMLQGLIYPSPFISNKMKGKSVADASSVEPALGNVRVTMTPWLENSAGNPTADKSQCYTDWLKNQKPVSVPKNMPPLEPLDSLVTQEESWLERSLFCPNSIQLRASAAAVFKQICATAPRRKSLVLDLLTRNLKQISEMGDRAHEFVSLYQCLLDEEQWKVYVASQGVLPRISILLLKEMETLSALENNTLATDIAQGYTIKVLTDLLISIVEIEKIRKRYKSQLLCPVLQSYLAVRSIVVQRTKLIDDAQAKLLELLELLTTGTESETKEFMTICVQTVKKCPPDDVRTPVFIFERLCSIIFPEEKEVGEFLISIEKDPAQEDFLQGRMAGNPYHSNDAGMGPLMRDIKNRICRDCELFSLLEDDTGMELLVGGKIMSLDLPVVEVFKKVWQPQHSGESMLVIYRMRGLLGDATEEFVETLTPKKGEKVNEEEVYRLSGVMGECGGIEVLLDRLTLVKNVSYASQLLSMMLNLFEYCVKVKRNRMKLTEPNLGAVSKFLTCLNLILSMKDAAFLPFAEKIFSILDRVITEANDLPEPQFAAIFGKTDTDKDFEFMLNLVAEDHSAFVASIKEPLLRTLPNLSLGSDARMRLLIAFFAPYVDFDAYDEDPTPKDSTTLDSFCALAKGIVLSKYGHELKQRFIEAGLLDAAMKYLVEHCPPLFKIGSTIDSPDWKEFLSRPSLKYVLRLLAGLARGHEPSQNAIARESIPIIHRLEQVSSEEHLGTLAEAVMEALRENPLVAKKIVEVREETRAKKKQMAMAMRQKQLGEMGMKIGDKGLVRVESGVLKDADLREETGLVCSICQEGYMAAPQKVLGIYTYSKRVNSDDYETKQRKTPAYSTVTHFNVIHLECHQTAVRSARGREEWESAMLHNANTRCNGLLPLWGPNVSESEFANHLARHNQYIQEHTGVTDIGFQMAVHDLKLLLNRFAQEKSFADESGGGGRSSNIHLIPYLSQVALYVMISSSQTQSQMKAVHAYFSLRPPDWVGLSYESEGHLYYGILTFLVSPPSDWQRRRIDLLKRLIITGQGRHVARAGASKSLPDTAIKDYLVYKPYLLFLAMVNGFYKYLYSEVKCDSAAEWPMALQTFIRQNDSKLLESTSKLLKHFEEDLLPCETFGEILEVCGMLVEVSNPDEFLTTTLASVA